MPHSPKPASDEALWLLLRQGDEAAFSALMRRYFGPLLNYGRKFTRDGERVKDGIQDLFAELWLYRARLAETTSVRTYLLTSLRRKLARSQPPQQVPDDEDTLAFLADFSVLDRWVEDDAERQQLAQLNRLLNALPPRQKEAIYLKFYQNLSNEEIAAVLEVNYQSASNLIHRALNHLRDHWPEETVLGVLVIFNAQCSIFNVQ